MSEAQNHWTGAVDCVESTEHHGPYITTEYGSTMCDFYTMSQPHLPSTASGGPSKPVPFLHEQADANAARFTACWNAMTGIEDPAAFMEEVREVAKKWMAYDELLRSIGDTIDADTLYKGVGPKVDAAYDDCVVATCNLLEKMEGK